MYTVVRVRSNGTVNHLNLENKQEALNAYYFSLFYIDEEDECFIGLFNETTLIMNNKERRAKP
jgi:hypothetical protein